MRLGTADQIMCCIFFPKVEEQRPILAFVPLQSQLFQAKCSLVALMQTKWTLLSDETQNDIQADAGKDESVESIRHIE